jgi:hypothetical protein
MRVQVELNRLRFAAAPTLQGSYVGDRDRGVGEVKVGGGVRVGGSGRDGDGDGDGDGEGEGEGDSWSAPRGHIIRDRVGDRANGARGGRGDRPRSSNGLRSSSGRASASEPAHAKVSPNELYAMRDGKLQVFQGT